MTTQRSNDDSYADAFVVQAVDEMGAGVHMGGRLLIYLGAAAGVGKTYAMLDEGHLCRLRGLDVVVALVETHGRPATEAHLADLEVVPRKIVEYRGARFEEMDLEAVLARRPQVALIDELAHTNVPGSGRNEKRWQDVRDLLAAEIDVITTINVQHIESLADVVERITGIAVRERVPDAVIRSADEIELVDSSPRRLRRRLLYGDVISPDRAREALRGFFTTETLTALRELTLRFVADEMPGDPYGQYGRIPAQARWETAERVLVGVSTGPENDVMLRRAARLAARLKADLSVAHIVVGDADPFDVKIDALRRLADDLGADWTDLSGEDPAAALVNFAGQRQITQIVVGPGRRSFWLKMLGSGSTIRRLGRLAGDAGIDVHVVGRAMPSPASTPDAGKRDLAHQLRRLGADSGPSTKWSDFEGPLSVPSHLKGDDGQRIAWGEGRDTNSARKLSIAGAAAALATMAVLTLAMLPFRGELNIATTALVLAVPVVVGVVIGGFRAGVISVVGGFLVYDFFFIPPYETLYVGVSENWVALGVYAMIMLPVARVVVSMNTARAQARQRAMQIRQLFELSALLVEDKPLEEMLTVIVNALRDVLDAHQVALLLPRNDDLEIVASAGAPLTEDDRRRLLPSPGRTASVDATRPNGTNPFGIALVAAGRPVGILTVSGTEITGRQREPLLLFANQIALAVERAQLREHVLRAGLTEEVERLARTLVAAVSHDLRAPLASVKASSSILADPQLGEGLDPHARHELAVLVDTQVDRLAALVTNLLDMSRVQAGMLQPRASIVHLHDLADTVLADLPLGRRDCPPILDLPDDLPLIDVDVVLIARVFTNLLENAIRHAPKDSPITIAARRADAATITVSVTDHGPGVSPDRRGEIFGLFIRRHGDSGSGLGLAIAKTFIDAHRQRIWVEDVPGGGARFCFTLPVAAPLQERS
ncbi:ATP-binding protein [Streptosporangium sp. 'caverna']|uniref:ATP-binding protein n=1 Tax=Streptosporangium sp. 'caverna' TaxID=2202249 RepID=UPI000D7D36B5|nr:ATP-binding protein [Streptosporangium sp. 'caverna']AWS47722.1 hypothetical protein DKM19_46995 [Streptosporangium sp. 'caverna']